MAEADLNPAATTPSTRARIAAVDHRAAAMAAWTSEWASADANLDRRDGPPTSRALASTSMAADP